MKQLRSCLLSLLASGALAVPAAAQSDPVPNGFTAVALESGFTPATLVDDFVQGGSASIDSVLKNGLTFGFGNLPENRELLLWLRDYNARAARKVHFYGMDLSGGAPGSVQDVLAYLEQVAPSTASGRKSRLAPMMSRLTEAGYAASSPTFADTTKFENVKWILGQEGVNARIVVHAANAHVMNNVLNFPNVGSTKELGAYLRPAFGKEPDRN